MELKDVILSAIAEIGEETGISRAPQQEEEAPEGRSAPRTAAAPEGAMPPAEPKRPAESVAAATAKRREEREFLEQLRERLLVFFEGFQSPNNRKTEAKIDLTLNFLEYLLALLDERIDRLKRP